MMKVGRGAALILAAFASPAFAESADTALNQKGHAADAAFAHAMMTMSMDAKLSGDTDRDFASLMIPHHQAAVDMARSELQYGADPELKALARSIISAQDSELATMKAWLAKRAR